MQAGDAKSVQPTKVAITELLLQRHNGAQDFIVQTQDDQVSAQAGVTQVLTAPAHVVSIATVDAVGLREAILVDDRGSEIARIVIT